MKKYIIILLLIVLSYNLSAKEKFQLTQVTYKAISKVQKLLDDKKPDEAKKLLLELKSSSKIRKKLDKAYIRFYLGYFFTLHDNTKEAITNFKEALSYKALAPEQTSNAYLNLTQLSMEEENYKDALYYLDEVIKLSKIPKAQYYVSKANIEMILKDYENVIQDIDKAIKIEIKAKESWLKMQYYSYYMLQDNKNAINTLKKLINIKPKDKEYWLQLSSLYSLIENFEYSLSSLDITHISSLDLNEQELLRLISWLQYSNVPHKAALIMQKHIVDKKITINEKNLNGLGDLYYEAKEYKKAIIWYKKSAKLNSSSKIYFKIAKIYANTRDYTNVILNLTLCLKNSDESLKGDKYLLLGKAYYELANLIDAKKSFYKAQKFKESKKMANAWLDYI